MIAKHMNLLYNIVYYIILVLALVATFGKVVSTIITVNQNNIIFVFLICTSFGVLSSVLLHRLIVKAQNRLKNN